MFLFINTINSTQLELGLFDFCGWKKRLKVSFSAPRNDRVLILLEKLLKRVYIKPQKLMGIAVLNGSGSFTGLRIGVTIANIAGFVLNLPVLTVESVDQGFIMKTARRLSKMKKFVSVKPFYEREPNITCFKKKNL